MHSLLLLVVRLGEEAGDSYHISKHRETCRVSCSVWQRPLTWSACHCYLQPSSIPRVCWLWFIGLLWASCQLLLLLLWVVIPSPLLETLVLLLLLHGPLLGIPLTWLVIEESRGFSQGGTPHQPSSTTACKASQAAQGTRHACCCCCRPVLHSFREIIEPGVSQGLVGCQPLGGVIGQQASKQVFASCIICKTRDQLLPWPCNPLGETCSEVLQLCHTCPAVLRGGPQCLEHLVQQPDFTLGTEEGL